MTTPLQPYHFVTSAYCETQLSLYTLPCALLCSAARPSSLYYAPSIALLCTILCSAAQPSSLSHFRPSSTPSSLKLIHSYPHSHCNSPPSPCAPLSTSIDKRHYRSFNYARSPTRYARIIHPNSLLYVDIIRLIHNRLQSYPQSTKQFYTTVDNVFHNSRYLYPHLSAHRADTTAHVIHTLCTAFSTPFHRFSTAIARFIHRLYTRYPHLSTTYPQHKRLFHRLYRAIHSHTQPLFAHLSTILSTRLSTLTSVINTPLRLITALPQTFFTHPYGSP